MFRGVRDAYFWQVWGQKSLNLKSSLILKSYSTISWICHGPIHTDQPIFEQLLPILCSTPCQTKNLVFGGVTSVWTLMSICSLIGCLFVWSVGWLDSWPVCHNFYTGREVTLPTEHLGQLTLQLERLNKA